MTNTENRWNPGDMVQTTEQYLTERIEAERRLFHERVAPFERQLAHLRSTRPPEYFIPQEKNDV